LRIIPISMVFLLSNIKEDDEHDISFKEKGEMNTML
jgi:hypothetical protein